MTELWGRGNVRQAILHLLVNTLSMISLAKSPGVMSRVSTLMMSFFVGVIFSISPRSTSGPTAMLMVRIPLRSSGCAAFLTSSGVLLEK